jgi:Uma2 family endonuclease
MANPAHLPVSVDEYLAMDEASEVRLEFIDGVVVAMAGASYHHNVIVSNLVANLHNLLKGEPCRALSSDMKTKLATGRDYVYPDVVVVCGEPELEKRRGESLANPRVVFEVLSPSTSRLDRGRKAQLYRAMPSLQAYATVEQDAPNIELMARNDADEWVVTGYDSREAVLPLACLGIELPLQEIYDGVEFGVEETA